MITIITIRIIISVNILFAYCYFPALNFEGSPVALNPRLFAPIAALNETDARYPAARGENSIAFVSTVLRNVDRRLRGDLVHPWSVGVSVCSVVSHPPFSLSYCWRGMRRRFANYDVSLTHFFVAFFLFPFFFQPASQRLRDLARFSLGRLSFDFVVVILRVPWNYYNVDDTFL